jgi:hypothetical protein
MRYRPQRLAALPVTLAVALAFCLCRPAVVHAGPKTDSVLLKNGNLVTCEIKRLDHGLLQVSTDSMGTLDIEWLDVVAVTSPTKFEVETTVGVRYFGSLAPGATGQLTVVEETRQEVLGLLDVVRIAPIRGSFWSRLDGNFGAGGSYTESSGVAQASLNFLIGAKRPAFEWRGSFDGTFTIQQSEPDTGRLNTQAGYTRLLRRRWVMPGTLTVERNSDLGYNVRSTAALGIGRRLVQTNRTVLQLGAGFAVNREVPVDGETTTNIELQFPFDYEFFTYNYPKTSVSVQVIAYTSVSDPGRFRFYLNSTLSRDLLTSDFYVAATLYDDFDNRPPTATASRNDVGVTFSLGWRF